MDVQLRLADIKDITKLLDMMQEFNAIDQYPFDRTLSEANLYDFIEKEHLGRLWLIETQEKSIGYIALTFGFSFEYNGRDAFIDEFYILEPFQNRGVGTRVLQDVFSQAKELKIKAIHLEVENRNTRATKLYLKSGFESNDRRLLSKKIS